MYFRDSFFFFFFFSPLIHVPPSQPAPSPPAQERVGAAEKARDAAHARVDDLYRAAKAEL
jgi:hypothetical protein